MAGLPDEWVPALELALSGRYRFTDCRTRREHRLWAPDVAAAFIVGRGVISHAARILGVGRVQIYRFLKRYPQMSRVRDEARAVFIDAIEERYLAAAYGDGEEMSGGQLSAMWNLMRTLGGPRGYSPKLDVQVEHTAGADWGALVEAASNAGRRLPGELIEGEAVEVVDE